MILDDIIKVKRQELKELKKRCNSLAEGLQKNEFSIIAEIKKASPSKGIISSNFNPELQLEQYERGGASAISVLTDTSFFKGSKEIFKKVRNKTSLPMLRKDFIIDPLQVYESFFLGADVILLIASLFRKKELQDMLGLTHKLGMEALVEINQADEVDKILDCDLRILGINNRDLRDFSVNLLNTELVLKYLDKLGVRDRFLLISESGISSVNDIQFLKGLGANGVLIGETLMRAKDPSERITEFLSV